MSAKPSIKLLREIWCEGDVPDEIYDEYEIVHDDVYDTWRHGSCHEVVFHRKSDDTLWKVYYRDNPSGDHNDFRDGDLDDSDVFPTKKIEKTIIIYE